MKNCFLQILQRVLLIVVFFLICSEKSNGQVIVETFETAPWTGTSFNATTNGSVTNNVTATTSSLPITSWSAANAVGQATLIPGQTATGNWEWVVSKVSTQSYSTATTSNNNNASKLKMRSAFRSVYISSSNGYLISPIITGGVASVTFWGAGGSGNGGIQIGLATNTTSAINTANFTLQLSGTASFSSNTARSFFSYSVPASVMNGSNARIGFLNTSSGGFWLDDITITSAAPSAQNPTAITFTTPSGCQNDQLTLTWTGPTGYNSANNTILAFLKQGTAVTVGTPTSTTYTANTNFSAGGTVYENDASAKCIYKGDGTNAAGDHSGLTITGLTANTTYHLLIFNVLDATSTFSSGGTTNLSTIKAEPSSQATTLASGTIATNNIPATWTAATGADGYLLQLSNSSSPGEPTDFTNPADQTNVSGGTALVKITGTTYSSFTGFSAGTMYYFKANAYSNSGTCIDYKGTGATMYAATLPNEPTAPGISIAGTTATINWTLGAGYNNTNHTTLVFVKASSAVTVGTPTNNPGGYTANTVYNSGTAYQNDATAKCVYNGDATSVGITGLTAGITYHVLILTAMVNSNSNTVYSYSAATITSGVGAVQYTWQGGNNSSWATAANWTPTRTSPAANDELIINTPSTVTCSNVPTQTIGKLTISGNCAVTLTGSSSTLTFTNNNGSADDLIINTGSSLIQGTSVDITMGANTNANISGTLTVNGSRTYNTNASSAVTTVTGTVKCIGDVTCTTAANFIVSSTGTYNHNRNTGTIPTGTWNTGSTCLITGVTSGNFSGHRQTFSKFVWDCASQSDKFVLGENAGSSSPQCVITDSFIVKRTNNNILQLTSSGAQRDFIVGNYFQYGGLVAISFDTDDGGTQRSLTVNNTFYVTDSLESNTQFQLINQPTTENIAARLFVKGNVEMHPYLANVYLAKISTNSLAEIQFTGTSGNQRAVFDKIVGDVDFHINNASGVTLASNATANRCKMLQGAFSIGSNTLTINGAVSYPSPGSATFSGSSTSNLNIGTQGHSKNDTTNNLYFTTGAQLLKNLSLSDTAKAYLLTPLSLTAGSSFGTLKLDTSAILTTNDQLTLKSDANGTARVDSLPVNGSGVAMSTVTGKIIIERYLPMQTPFSGRRWRLMGVPISATGAPTIKTAWQENATATPTTASATNSTSIYNPNPGYGTHITNGVGSTNNALGFDAGSTANPSIYKTEPGSSLWTVPSSTASLAITNYNAYMLFVRGNRGIVVSNQYINTTGGANLRITGNINTGKVTKTIVAGRQVLSNPYPSTISMKKVTYGGTVIGTTIGKTYYMWDPKLLGSKGVGSWVTFSSNGSNTFAVVPNPIDSGYMSTFSSAGTIESGNAFMINATAGGSFVFQESDKLSSSTTTGLASRPVSGNRPVKTPATLYTNLAYVDNSGNPILADGVLTMYTDEYNNDVDEQDAAKLQTFLTKEKISLLRDDSVLAIERRNTIFKDDTIFLQMDKLDNYYNYQLQFIGENFAKNLTAYLVDKYLNKNYIISTEGITRYDFTTNGEAGSIDTDRFKIVFKLNGNAPLPVNFSLINAVKNGSAATVSWKVENEINVNYYEIEKSSDGINFTTINVITSTNTVSSVYSWVDHSLNNGTNFYRIKSIDKDGKILYSKIVTINDAKPSNFTVYPNPTKDGKISVGFNNTQKGLYEVKLINNAGQLLYNKKVNYSGGNTMISFPKLGSKGVYHIEINKPDLAKELIEILY